MAFPVAARPVCLRTHYNLVAHPHNSTKHFRFYSEPSVENTSSFFFFFLLVSFSPTELN